MCHSLSLALCWQQYKSAECKMPKILSYMRSLFGRFSATPVSAAFLELEGLGAYLPSRHRCLALCCGRYRFPMAVPPAPPPPPPGALWWLKISQLCRPVPSQRDAACSSGLRGGGGEERRGWDERERGSRRGAAVAAGDALVTMVTPRVAAAGGCRRGRRDFAPAQASAEIWG